MLSYQWGHMEVGPAGQRFTSCQLKQARSHKHYLGKFTLTIHVLSLKGCLQTFWFSTQAHYQQNDFLRGGCRRGERLGQGVQKLRSEKGSWNNITLLTFQWSRKPSPSKSHLHIWGICKDTQVVSTLKYLVFQFQAQSSHSNPNPRP